MTNFKQKKPHCQHDSGALLKKTVSLTYITIYWMKCKYDKMYKFVTKFYDNLLSVNISTTNDA
jgi:hypothetical protein